MRNNLEREILGIIALLDEDSISLAPEINANTIIKFKIDALAYCLKKSHEGLYEIINSPIRICNVKRIYFFR